jgi:Inverse autotransporter, beta-domain
VLVPRLARLIPGKNPAGMVASGSRVWGFCMFLRLGSNGRCRRTFASGITVWLILFCCLLVTCIQPAQAIEIGRVPEQLTNEMPARTLGFSDSPRFSRPVPAPSSSLLTGRRRSISLAEQLQGGLFPEIPNFQASYIFDFGPKVRHSRLSVDYLIPAALSDTDLVFYLVHTTIHDFGKTPLGSDEARLDLSSGAGYRKVLGTRFLLGVNVFRDSSRISGAWRNSWSVGLESAAMFTGNSAVDLSVNYYGNLFSDPDSVLNAYRKSKGNYDVELGYSLPFPDERADLRMKLRGYRFHAGGKVYGWSAGATLTTSDGLLSVKYEHSRDGINGSYNSIGGYVSVGLELERLLSWESPIAQPDPVFRSPRGSGRLLRRSLSRIWSLPSSIVVDETGL